MAILFHYFPYILGAGLAMLMLVCFFDGGAKKHVEPRRPKPIYYRWDDSSSHRK